MNSDTKVINGGNAVMQDNSRRSGGYFNRRTETMTISEVIEICDRLTPNAYTETDKVRWLMALDQLIYNDVITTHEGAEQIAQPEYTADDMTQELVVSEPYAEDVYVNYLQAKIAQNNGEDAKYNKAIIFYNDAYTAYARAYNEQHKAIPPGTFFRF